MTIEEQRQREERAGVTDFRARFDAHMEDLKQRDRAEATPREYDARFDVKQDLEQQRGEKVGQIEKDFTQDKTDLALQNQQDKREFENWVQASRDTMRHQDNAPPQQVAAPGLDLKYEPPQSNREFPDRERARDAAEAQMKKEFEGYRSQKEQALESKRDGNIDGIEKSQRNYKQFPWETEATHQDRVAAAEEYAQLQAQQQRDKPPEITGGFIR